MLVHNSIHTLYIAHTSRYFCMSPVGNIWRRAPCGETVGTWIPFPWTRRYGPSHVHHAYREVLTGRDTRNVRDAGECRSRISHHCCRGDFYCLSEVSINSSVCYTTWSENYMVQQNYFQEKSHRTCNLILVWSSIGQRNDFQSQTQRYLYLLENIHSGRIFPFLFYANAIYPKN